MTPAVHYLRFAFSEDQVDAFAATPEVALVVTHPAYEVRTVLTPRSGRSSSETSTSTTKRLPMG